MFLNIRREGKSPPGEGGKNKVYATDTSLFRSHTGLDQIYEQVQTKSTEYSTTCGCLVRCGDAGSHSSGDDVSQRSPPLKSTIIGEQR